MITAFLPLISKIFDTVLPDPKAKAEAQLRLAELQQTGDMTVFDGLVKLALAQIGVNQEEAKSTNWFVAGWRPAVGWVCTSGLVYQFVVQPILTWLSLNFGIIAPPVVDTGTLMTMLMGLLGLGTMRTYEKFKEVARDL